MRYDKLIRDKIPDIIRQKGGMPVVHIAEDEEYRVKLREKLQEEVNEFLESGSLEEIADIFEVLMALVERQGATWEQVKRLRVNKALDRGAFRERIILEES